VSPAGNDLEPAAGLPTRAIEIVASLAAHRTLSTAQIRLVHMSEAGMRRTQQVMARIAAAGLAGATDSAGSPQRLWFATEAGARAAVASGALPRAARLFEAREVVGRLPGFFAGCPKPITSMDQFYRCERSSRAKI